jgi:hypothetical protein
MAPLIQVTLTGRGAALGFTVETFFGVPFAVSFGAVTGILRGADSPAALEAIN